jgi:hypothetical protein
MWLGSIVTPPTAGTSPADKNKHTNDNNKNNHNKQSNAIDIITSNQTPHIKISGSKYPTFKTCPRRLGCFAVDNTLDHIHLVLKRLGCRHSLHTRSHCGV